jgi:hypothetical protein
MERVTAVAASNDTGIMGLLMPFSQVVIGVCVLAAVLVCAVRLARRGPSRMLHALLVTGACVAGVTVLGLLLMR